MQHEFEALKRYVKRKGEGYFYTAPDEEREALEGILYDNNCVIPSVLRLLLS